MASSPLLMRLLSASVTLSHRSGKIIRDILKTGDLGIHDKVRRKELMSTLLFLFNLFIGDFYPPPQWSKFTNFNHYLTHLLVRKKKKIRIKFNYLKANFKKGRKK